jgi:hypothetical protein
MTASHAGQYPATHHPIASRPLCVVFGAIFLAIGVIGFFITGFDDFFAHDTGEELLWFEVNPAHNVVHLLFGVAGIALARTVRGALTFGLLVGIGYAAALVYGLFAIDETWDFLSVNTADNWLHAVLAVLGFGLAALAANELRDLHDDRAGVDRDRDYR